MKRPEPDDFAQQIARYNQELLQASRRAQAASVPEETVSAATEPPSDPTPAAPPTPAPVSPAAPSNGSDYPRDGMGYLQVQVFTAREATPLSGAQIQVYETTPDGDRFVSSARSDISGFSPAFPLPTVSTQLSLTPEVTAPYVSYAVQVDYPGYYRVRTNNVPIFNNIVSRQPIFLIPLPEQENGDDLEIRYPSGENTTLH